MQKLNRKTATAFIMLSVLILIFISSLVGGVGTTHASTVNYSDVLSDLKLDKQFNAKQYPVDNSNYALQVIQIAETKDKELLIYVYNPSAFTRQLTASSINISTEINDSLHYKNYTLKRLNANGVFAKYVVEKFTVKDDALRYYDIASIFRKWDKDIDTDVGNDNAVSEVSFEVGKRYTASTVDGKVSYTCLERQTIIVTTKYVGYIQYLNGFKWYTSKCDSHYVAFDTDMPIDTLYEADVEFVPIAYKKSTNLVGHDSYWYKTPGDVTPVTFTNEDVVKNPVGLWGKQYEWTRIESVSDFIAKEDLTDETKQKLSDKKWVLRFYESEFKTIPDFTGDIVSVGTIVEDVTILRLKFETDGVVYNLGVVDNKQSETMGQKPDNNNTNEFEFWGANGKDIKRTLKIVLAVLAGIVLIVVVCWVIRIIAVPTKVVSKAIKATKKKNKR